MEMVALLLILIQLIFKMVFCTDAPVVNISNTNTSTQDTTVSLSSEKPTNTCTLIPVLPSAGEDIAGLANSDKQLVKITVTIKADNGAHITEDTRLKHWVIATSLTGNSMLMLKESFDTMSLYTLGLGVESYSVKLNQEPPNCLSGKRIEEIENILRSHFLNSFGASEQTLPSGAEICNKDIGKEEGNRDRLVYVCCKQNQENQLHCSELTQSIWIQLLFISIIVLQVLIILYSPIYMPGFMYKAKGIFQKYSFTTEPDKSLQIRLKLVTDSSNIDNGFLKAELNDFTHLEKFKMQLKNLTPDKVHTLMVKSIDLCVRDSKIVAEGNAPVSFFTFIKDFFVRCKIRYDIRSVGDCCMQDMWVKLPCKTVFRWYQCLSGIMVLVVLLFLASPWLLRVWFYYSIEEEQIKYQSDIYEKFNLKRPYPGNMVTYFSPTHPFFLVIYILFAVELFIYIVLPGTIKEKVKCTTRKCFRDTRDTSKLGELGKIASHMMRPLKLYGVVGCVVLPLWLIVFPLYCVVIAIEIIPIANLSVRLLVNLIFYISKVINPNMFRRGNQQIPSKLSIWMEKKFKAIIVVNKNEANTRWNKLLHSLVLIMTFVSVWLFLILMIECIAFYVECAVYAMVGFILNPLTILKYASLLLLIAIYGCDSFSGVHGRYAGFSTGLSSEVQGMVGDKMTEEASKSIEKQQNTAFMVPARDYVPERMCLVAGSEGFLEWKVSRLVLLLDKTDTPYIPTAFLFQMGQLNHFQCPGFVHLLYLKATLDFSLILLFLAFVFIVIFAFGQADDISSAGQAILALGTGFFPLILKKFLFKSQSFAFDSSNLHWKSMFGNAVQRYSEKWNFEDIIIAETDETELKPAADVALTEMKETNATEMNDLTVVCNTNDKPDDRILETNGTEQFTDLYKINDTIGDDHRGCSAFVETIDLVVKRSGKLEGEESMTFFVPTASFDRNSLYTEDETLL